MIPGTHVGLDATYKSIHVGDTIMDANGRRYTVDEHGRAATEGGQVRNLTDLQEIVVVRTWAPAEVKLRTFTPNAKTVDPDEQRRAKAREYQRRFRERHKEDLKRKREERRRAMTSADHAKEAAYQRKYYDAHRDEINARRRAKRKASRESSVVSRENVEADAPGGPKTGGGETD